MAKKGITMNEVAMGVIAIVAGILVLAWPRFLAYTVGIFLIVWGVLAIIAYYRR